MQQSCLIRRILPEGKFPSERELQKLEPDESGFSWYLQKSSQVPSGVTANIVKQSHNSQGRPCFKLAGLVEVKEPSIDNSGIEVLLTAGRYQRVVVPTMWDAYALIRANWELNT